MTKILNIFRKARKHRNRHTRFKALFARVCKIQRDHGASYNPSSDKIAFCKTATFNVIRTTRVIDFGRKHNLLSPSSFPQY